MAVIRGSVLLLAGAILARSQTVPNPPGSPVRLAIHATALQR